MVFYHCLISVDQHIHMDKTVNSADPCLKLRQINQFYKNRKTSNSQNQLNIPACEQSRYAMIDVIFFIVTIGAVGVLLNPSVSHLVRKTVELGEEVVDVVREEIVNAPIVFGCLGLSILFTAIALVIIAVCIDRRCGKPGCKGLRKAAEFDLHLETEERLKMYNYAATNGLKKGLIELPRDHHRELEAELKKMAPPNGRAVLVFRARCGCSIGRMEVPGQKKSRKVKK
ncbi:uncharacterized protein At5g19025-like [Olea europaea var. sylvestris]|uniref:uncharacterized protein At5g19025-like n=1 Tax=Olea europaea var. sylvestris TaxID=158386 RepID=UPI000C1D36A6|nr:uncharacterized protein At5g19025-like [Olea europaea var. sylvestris]